MSKLPREILKAKSRALEGRYQLRFADKPRETRSMVELNVLIQENRELISSFHEIAEGDEGTLASELQERQTLFERERQEILSALERGGDYSVQGAILARQLAGISARYGRHFSGEDRRTRDVGLLVEMMNELESIQRTLANLTAQSDLQPLRDKLQRTTETLAFYSRERDAIIEAQGQGEPEVVASLLAHLANRQFDLYQLHFAGQARISRRVGLLERIVSELERIEARMTLAMPLVSAETSPSTDNLSVVRNKTATYLKEVEAIEESHRVMPALHRIEVLSRLAGDIIETYRKEFGGNDRTECDASRLSLLSDQLADAEREISDLISHFGLDNDYASIGLVRDFLSLFDKEYELILKAQLH